MGFLHREGGIGGDTSHNALKWVPSMYNSFDHFPKQIGLPLRGRPIIVIYIYIFFIITQFILAF